MAGARRLANEVRAGLEQDPQEAPKKVANQDSSPLLEMWMGKPVGTHVREFGAIFGTIGFTVCAFKLYKGSVQTAEIWGAVGAVFALLGYLAPRVLLPVWRGWMKMAHYLSIVMTFVILSAAWTIGFVPMAYLLKILRIKPMNLSYKAKVSTYWETRDTKYDDFKRLELQY